MNKIKIILYGLVLLLLAGCGATSNYYVLSSVSQPARVYSHQNRIIGVEKVTIPMYLYKENIAIAKTSSQIGYLGDAEWGEDLDDGLTNRLITFLQKKFNQPRVYAYPWHTDMQPTVKIRVNITRFIAQGSRVYLDANWEVKQLSNGRIKSHLFSTSIPTKAENSASIVTSMDAAFKQLENAIANGLRVF